MYGELFSMHPTVRMGLASSSVIVPGMYYYHKNYANDNAEYNTGKNNMYKGYVSGACWGLIPYVNFAILTGLSLGTIAIDINDWFRDEKTKLFRDNYDSSAERKKAKLTGFICGCISSGITFFGNRPGFISRLRKI